MKIPEDIIEYIKEQNKKEHSESYLISVLHLLQDRYGYLDKQMLKEVSYLMNIPFADITGVATFYHYFTLNPIGKHTIYVCMGTACHVKGAEGILKELEKELGIKTSETTKDGMFTLKMARCLGTCALAPVVKIDEVIYSKVTPDKISKIIESYYLKKN